MKFRRIKLVFKDVYLAVSKYLSKLNCLTRTTLCHKKISFDILFRVVSKDHYLLWCSIWNLFWLANKLCNRRNFLPKVLFSDEIQVSVFWYFCYACIADVCVIQIFHSSITGCRSKDNVELSWGGARDFCWFLHS